LRQSKGQNVQSFTEEFRKKDLELNIPLDSYETLMKYIGALHSYIRHTFLLFNPTITKQCRVRFSIASKLIDEVDLYVVPIDICGIVLGSPYLYDRKTSLLSS
jgi:hypothetical protein